MSLICDLVPLQDEQKLYMGLESCPNGDLYEQLRQRKPLPLPEAISYAAEMVLMLECLRQNKIVFRCAPDPPHAWS